MGCSLQQPQPAPSPFQEEEEEEEEEDLEVSPEGWTNVLAAWMDASGLSEAGWEPVCPLAVLQPCRCCSMGLGTGTLPHALHSLTWGALLEALQPCCDCALAAGALPA